MKLKKFAAMMLAGVMAVSMLAGCSGKGTNGGNNGANQPEPTPETGIVAAFNNGQDEDNDVKVAFTADSGLEAALTKVIKATGSAGTVIIENWQPGFVSGMIQNLTGKTYSPLYTENNIDTATDKEVVTELRVMEVFNSADYWTKSDVVNAAARNVNRDIADLFSNNRSDTQVGEKYWNCEYTGTVAMVSVDNGDGSTSYFVAYTLTQTVSHPEVTVAA